jgi:type IV secretion system protein VirD4
MKVKNIKPILLKLPYLAFVYLFDKLCQAFRLSIRDNVLDTFLSLGEGFAKAFETFAPSFHPIDLTVSVFGTGLIFFVMYVRGLEARKYRKGKEYGSARWGNADNIAPYIDPVFENNVLLTNTERLMMSSRPSHPKYARNKNVLVVGGSGSGKTRFYVKPNLMQMHSSYVVTDPKGTVLIECGKMLQRAGYKIKVLNTINFKKSMHYNPFAYIHNETDILKLVNTLIENTKGDGEKIGEDFWVKAEKLYYCALIGYIHYEAPESEKNISTLLDMINASEAREDDEEFQNPVDLMFERLEEKDPEHFAVKQYKKYKLAAGKTAKSILISCGARLAPFDIKELRVLMETDEMELDTLGDWKTALFIISSDTNSTFDFVNALICSQLFNVLCTKADDVYGGRLPVHVRCLLDEFANIKIPDMQRLIAVLRSREISCSLVVQSQSQLKAIYKDHADTIVGNCDTMLFLGGKEKTTLKEISEILGKETIDSFNKSENRGREVSHGLNFQKLGKELMTQDEIATMDGSKCILQVRGVRPFLSDKFDITAHPNYKYLSDFDKKNAFDPEKELRRRPAIVGQNEVFDYYEIDVGNAE